MWMAALCADQSTLATPVTVVASTTAAPGAPGGLRVVCPSGTEAVGGGVAPGSGLSVLASGPTVGTTLGNHPDGAAGTADGWAGSAFNPTANPVTVKVAVICLTTMKEVLRLGGTDRIDTAVNVSKFLFPTGTATPAKTVVLARSDPGQFADALVGQPLAFAKGGPILLTPSTSLDPRTQAEIQRLLPAGGTVTLLGGTVAITPAVQSQLVALGYTIVRYGGVDRFATAAIIADQGLGNPTTVFETTGLDFADALTAGAAASHLTASVLLTAGSTVPGPTAAYLAAHPPTKRYAVGGPAAAADPSATAESGSDRYATSAAVATNLFSAPTVAGLATGLDYPDALSGGTFMSFARGPLVLVQPDAVPATVASYLKTNGSTLVGGFLFGGTTAVSEATRVAIGQAMEP
jgi:putative cell wall-binding protein